MEINEADFMLMKESLGIITDKRRRGCIFCAISLICGYRTERGLAWVNSV
jgi:hypothetical protein